MGPDGSSFLYRAGRDRSAGRRAPVTAGPGPALRLAGEDGPVQWIRRPLAFLLPLQALIGFFHLGLLSPWMDEAGTLMAMRRSLAGVLEFAAQDVHPPLYYLLLHWWLAIPLGLRWEVQGRALSVIFALLATVALDRLWARFLPDRLRWWLLLLWVL